MGSTGNFTSSGPATFAGTGITISPAANSNVAIASSGTITATVDIEAGPSVGKGIAIGTKNPQAAALVGIGRQAAPAVKVRMYPALTTLSTSYPGLTSGYVQCQNARDVLVGGTCNCLAGGGSTTESYPLQSGRWGWQCGCSAAATTTVTAYCVLNDPKPDRSVPHGHGR